LAAAGLLASLSFGQQFSLSPSPENVITMNHELAPSSPAFTSINGTSYQDFTKSHKITHMKAGAPALPYFSESVIVPNHGQVTLDVDHDGYIEYQNVEIAPSKGSLKRNVNPSDVDYTFGAEYNTDAFYPGQLAFIGSPFNLRNTRGTTVSVSPYQYNPVTKTLRVYQNVRAHVVTNDNETGINELDSEYRQNDVFNAVYENHFINSNEVFGRYTPVEEEGEMLVIAKDAFIDEMEPFVDWKNQSGIKTTIVGTSTAGSTDTQIKSYIQNFYGSNPDLVYVLLVGDHADVPSHTYGSSGWEQLWSDSYYGQLTGGANDYYPELFVGRFSGNPTQITTMVNRTLEYEKTPATGDWMTRAIGLASDEGQGYGDDGEPDWQHARNIRTTLMGYGYTTVHEFYDGSHGGEDAAGNPTSAIISPAVNEGVGLFNYTGHGDQNTCITGNYGSTHINSATNNGAYPFVISVACNNGSFTSGTCISEVWMRATNAGSPSGSIAACGSSILMAWAQPMQVQDEMSELIAETYANNRKSTLGGLFYNAEMSMLEDYNSDGSSIEVMQTWVLFGDPSTIFRNKVTMNMAVSHVGNVPLGTSSVNVTCDTDGAKISIWQDGVFLGSDFANGGSANISFPGLTSNQPLVVTGTKQNYRPYQGIITVADGPAGIDENELEGINIYPNPATNELNVAWNSTTPESVIIRDLSGKVVYTNNAVAGTKLTITTSEFSSGMYLLQVNSNNKTKVTKVTIK
ncbi:MAG: C25 family cysteine peptidase, partial [Crocinitomicaceae bacterium]